MKSRSPGDLLTCAAGSSVAARRQRPGLLCERVRIDLLKPLVNFEQENCCVSLSCKEFLLMELWRRECLRKTGV